MQKFVESRTRVPVHMIVTVEGPSGVGKTCLLKVLADAGYELRPLPGEQGVHRAAVVDPLPGVPERQS